VPALALVESVAPCERRGRSRKIDVVQVDDIIRRLAWLAKLYGGSHRGLRVRLGKPGARLGDHDLVTEEKAALQKGMNYRVGKKYSIFLMSLRDKRAYAGATDEVTGMLDRIARFRYIGICATDLWTFPLRRCVRP
jgi:hypothetical protein